MQFKTVARLTSLTKIGLPGDTSPRGQDHAHAGPGATRPAGARRLVTCRVKGAPPPLAVASDFASHLIRLGEVDQGGEAETLLLALPPDGRVLQQLVKLFCAQGRVDEAIEMMDGRNWEVRPERYKTPIQVEINIAKSQFELALSALRTVPPDDEHLVGLKRKVYLRRARSERNATLRKRIAADGLSVPIDPALRRNIPIMVTSARLALLVEDVAAFDELVTEILQMNEEVGLLLKDEEAAETSYWEEEPFDT